MQDETLRTASIDMCGCTAVEEHRETCNIRIATAPAGLLVDIEVAIYMHAISGQGNVSAKLL